MRITTKSIICTIIDKGAYVSILSFTAWQDIGSPLRVPATDHILALNRRPTMPLGILPHLPITLEGKTVYIDVMVVQDPLYFNLLHGCDYVDSMKFLVSILFRVMYFTHDGNIVTVDKLSFIKPDHHMTPNHQTSLNVSHVLVVPSPCS